jgi:tetratricopeptide (TPR) repeat protein
MKKSYFILLSLFFATSFFGQNNSKDSLAYISLFNQYEALADQDRVKSFDVLSKIITKGTAENNNYYLSEALVYKAILFYYDSQFDSAKVFIDKALLFGKKGNNFKTQMRAYNLLGAICFNEGDFKNSVKYYNEKIKVGERNNDTAGVFGTYYNLGLVFFQQGNYLKSADYNFKALEYFERVKDTFNIISSLHSIAVTYVTLGDATTSLKFFKKAIGLARAFNNRYPLGGLYVDVATAYNKVNDSALEMKYIDLALKVSQEQNDDFNYTTALNLKATYFLRQNNYIQALLLSREAEKLNLKANRKLSLNEVYLTLAYTYYEKKELDSSLKYGFRCYNNGIELQQKTQILKSSKIIAQVNEAKRNADSAVKYYKVFIAFSDTMKSESQLRGIAQKEFLFEKRNQEELRAKEKLLADTKLEKQKQINLIVVFASILLAIFLMIGIINYRQKQKANALVLAQKKLLEEKQKEILDSINYASRIQNSLMPTDKYISKSLKKLKS